MYVGVPGTPARLPPPPSHAPRRAQKVEGGVGVKSGFERPQWWALSDLWGVSRLRRARQTALYPAAPPAPSTGAPRTTGGTGEEGNKGE